MMERAMPEGELRTLIAKALIDEVSALGCETWHFSVIENERFGQDEDTTNAAMFLAGVALAVLRPHLGPGVTAEQRAMMTTALDGIERAVTEFEGAELRRWVAEYVSVLRAIAGRGE